MAIYQISTVGPHGCIIKPTLELVRSNSVVFTLSRRLSGALGDGVNYEKNILTHQYHTHIIPVGIFYYTGLYDNELTFCCCLLVEACKPGFFQCKNGQCLHEQTVCDGNRDCEDGTDETSLASCCKFLLILFFTLIN